ncbi:MAG: hypothetical protein ACRBB0_24390 [Pelagimonas sp.]|uniref:hypothetical protein n=1 Tax=Pelagimonas sp. TaxID=2073170 RepID=UPI003D6C043C
MLPQDGPQTPESALVTAILMQAYRDLFIATKTDGSSTFTTQAEQDQAISFLTDSTGSLARNRNALCSLIGWDGDVLAERIRAMMDGADFPPPTSNPTLGILARHRHAVERIRARWHHLNSPPPRPSSLVEQPRQRDRLCA